MLGLLLAGTHLPAQEYYWTTIAGLYNGPGSADGTNSAALFSGPKGVAADGAGNIFVTDNYTVRKVTPLGGDWVTTTIAGKAGVVGTTDGAGGAARFATVPAVLLDSSGKLYLGDHWQPFIGSYAARLRSVTPVGASWVVASARSWSVLQSGPYGFAADSAGNLYAGLNNTLIKLTPVGQGWSEASLAGVPGVGGSMDGTNSAARLYGPSVFAVDSVGTIFLADTGSNDRIFRKATPVAGNWVVTTLPIPTGTYSSSASGFAALDSSGTLYFTADRTVRKAVPHGTNWVVASIGGMAGVSGGADGSGSTALFSGPTGVAVDSSGTVYVADFGGNTIRRGVPMSVLPLGTLQVNLAAGSGTLTGAQWRLNAGLWQSNGAVVTNLLVGSHIVAFASVYGWATPTNQVVVINSNQTTIATGTYVQQFGSLTVNGPAGAAAAGAQWQFDGGSPQALNTTLSNLTVGEHSLTFLPAPGWITPSNQTVSISPNSATTVTADYIAFGSVQVTINPAAAVIAGASWRLDAGEWQSSGTILSNLIPGSHVVEFSPLRSWSQPIAQAVTVNSGQMATVTGAYVALGSLQVGIGPAGAVSAGARWRVDGGAWQSSGATVTNLPAGSHTVGFSSLAGWTAPVSQSVTVSLNQTTTATGIYQQQTGFLQVLLSPAGVVSAGAQWQLDGGPWQLSGTLLTNVGVGSHTVAFYAVNGWTTPTNQTVVVASNQTARVTGVYTAQGALQVTLLPPGAAQAGAQWQVDGGAWLASGVTLAELSRGPHTVSFSSIPGWVAPASQTVTLFANQTATATGTYSPLNYRFTTLAGLAGSHGFADGINAAARFRSPAGVVVTTEGTVFLADTGNSVIRKLTHVGAGWEVTTIAGLAGSFGSADGTNSDARFNYPVGLAVDGFGNLYVADQVNSTIRKLTLAGTNWVATTLAGAAGYYGTNNGTGSAARFFYPSGVAVDGAGVVYVADQVNSAIRKLAPSGSNWVVSTIAGLGGSPGGANGTNAAARFYWPGDIAVDSNTNLYVADTFNDAIRKVSPVGANWVVSTVAGQLGVPGSADGAGSEAQFNGPTALALGAGGNLYVADTYNSTLRKLTAVGTNWVVNTIGGLAGSSGATDGTNHAARFAYPQGVAVATNGMVYVADTDNATLRQGEPYAAAQMPAFVVGIESSGSAVVLAWGAVPGRNYQLQYQVGQTAPDWSNLGAVITATNGTLRATDPSAEPQRFYRVVLLP